MVYLVDFNTDFRNYTLQFRKKAGNGAISFRKQAAIVHFIDLENPVEYAEKVDDPTLESSLCTILRLSLRPSVIC